MRLWSLHPGYLDRQGLVALWREALLAQKVLAGATRGYRHHPQLLRFRAHAQPAAAIAAYLHGVLEEARRRGYRFDATKIGRAPAGADLDGRLDVTSGQLRFEREHLAAKLRLRDRGSTPISQPHAAPRPHPLFRVVEGPVADWEKGTMPRGLER